jgi:hypothetical protein
VQRTPEAPYYASIKRSTNRRRIVRSNVAAAETIIWVANPPVPQAAGLEQSGATVRTRCCKTFLVRASAIAPRNPRLRYPLWIGLAVAILLSSTAATLTASSAVAIAPASVTVTGEGSQSSSSFHLRSGLAIFSASVTGRSTSTLYLENGKGLIQPWAGLTLTAPLRAGSGFDVVKSGEYRLSIVTTGHWKITITWPRLPIDAAGPTEFSGSGPRVVGPIDALNVKITMILDEPDGQKVTETGQTVSVANEHQLIVSSDSSWQSSCPTPPAGPYYLDIAENFSWTVVVGSDRPPWAVYTSEVPGALNGSTFVGGDHCPILLPSESN